MVSCRRASGRKPSRFCGGLLYSQIPENLHGFLTLMKFRPLALLALLLSAGLPASAADLVGKWTSAFDSQIGQQKYAYEFKHTGDQVTGQATYEHPMGKGSVELKAIKLEGDKVSFTETLTIDGNTITISYHGTIAGDEMKLTREVGTFATEEIVAKRVTAQKGGS
jgi:hypothetical protein